METKAAQHLAADALDAHQLLDGAERVLGAVGDDVADLGGSDAGEQLQLVGGGGVDVDHAFELPLTRRTGGVGGDEHEEQEKDDQPAREHHSVVGWRARKLRAISD